LTGSDFGAEEDAAAVDFFFFFFLMPPEATPLSLRVPPGEL